MTTGTTTTDTPLLHAHLRKRLVGSTICYPASVDPAFDLERSLAGLHAVGFEQVELFGIDGYCEHVDLDDVGPAAAERLRRQLERHSLTPVALNFATKLDTDEGVAHFGRAAELAERLGARVVVANVESVSTPETEQAFFERVPAIVASAKRQGVVLALETHGGLVSTMADGADLVDRVGSEHVKVAYDMANVVKYGRTVPDRDLRDHLARIADTIGYVHLKDKADLSDRYDYPPFGDGILDFPTVLELLEQGGYRGLLAVEVELDGRPASPEVVDEALHRSLAYLERIWKAGDES